MRFPGEPPHALQLAAEGDILMDKRLKRPFEPPQQGHFEFAFQYENSIPGLHQRATSGAVAALKVRRNSDFMCNLRGLCY